MFNIEVISSSSASSVSIFGIFKMGVKGHKWTKKGYKWPKKNAKNELYFFSPPSISCQPPLVFLSDDIFIKNPKGNKDEEKGFVCMIFHIARNNAQHITI